MTATGGIVAVRGPAPAVSPATGRLFAAALELLDGVTVADDLQAAVARLDGGSDGGGAVLAVVGPDVDRPLSTALELRRVTASLTLVLVVDPADVEETEVRLGLMPELRGADVVTATGTASELAARLERAAVAAGRRRDVEGALAALNRQLLRPPSEELSPRASVSESYLAALTRHVPEAIVAVDRDARIVATNEGAARTFPMQERLGEGETLAAVFGPAARQLEPLVEEALGGRTRTGQEVWVDTSDGRRVLAAFTTAPVRDHAERIIGAVLVARDVTERRHTEARLRELQKAQSLATLAGGVAHDFNNLLVSVRGWAELAADDLDDVELVTTALDRIRVAADRAAELARAMLVYSGRGRFELGPVDVAELVGEMAELLRGTVGRRAELRIELADDVPTVQADATQLRQVVLNLVTNAAEAVDGDGGTITVRTRGPAATASFVTGSQLPPGRYVALEVADTGPGMDPDTAARVFEPFFTTKFEGRGLGLAASDGIARAHGGSLTVDSAPGAGATFRLLLPVAEEERA